MHGPYQGEGKQAICLNQAELASDKHKNKFGRTRKSVYVEVRSKLLCDLFIDVHIVLLN